MRFPLPSLVDDKLVMPNIKQADGPTPAPAAPDLWHRPAAPTAPTAPTPSLWRQPSATPAAPTPNLWHRPGPAQPSWLSQHGPGLAADAAVGTGVDLAASRAVPAIASNMGMTGARAVPSMVPFGPSNWNAARMIGTRGLSGARAAGLWATPVNIGTDLLDAAGIYSMDGSKEFNAWQRPRLNMNGDTMRDAQGNAQWDVGFNPNGLGFNMREFDRGTTPDGTALGTTWSGNAGSYGLSSTRAFFNPLKSTTVLGRQILETPSQMSGTARHYAQQGWRPGPGVARGTPVFEQEAQLYRNQNRYHPTYNPSGTNNRPGGLQTWWNSLWH